MTAHASLTLQLLEWIAEQPRRYRDVMDAWKTTCPHLAIWEDACADGLLDTAPDHDTVQLTDKGRRLLHDREPRA